MSDQLTNIRDGGVLQLGNKNEEYLGGAGQKAVADLQQVDDAEGIAGITSLADLEHRLVGPRDETEVPFRYVLMVLDLSLRS